MVRCHCGKQAIYNVRGEKKGLFCSDHKTPEMVNVKNKTCESAGCEKQPAYNVRGTKKGLFCADHKTPEMVDVKHETCESAGCEKIPAYNVRGAKKGRFCAEHKTFEMVNVKDKMCESAGCEKIPNYNVRGTKKGRFCADHKNPEMANVKSKTCESAECEKQPTYNVRGTKKGLFCADHKTPEMVDVKHETCESAGCEKIPAYNVRGAKKGRFCAEHKTSEMVNVVSKTCESAECDKRPAYNVRGAKKARFCADHKTPDMVNVRSKTCVSAECDKQPVYGWLGKYNSRCGPHRQKGMIRSPNRKCETACCRQLGTHESHGSRFCEDHMPAGAENLGIQTCTSCGLDDILTDGKCGTCDPRVIQTRRHAKENRVRDILTAARFEFVHDRMLEGTSCGRERPDFQLDCGTHFVYVEVDEHQHGSYACECEQVRMINLVEVRGMPVRWIRYNPDSYDPAKGQRRMKIEQREKKLVEYIRWAMRRPPDGAISSVLYLFYDEHDSRISNWEKLV